MEAIKSIIQVLSIPKYFVMWALSSFVIFSFNILVPNYQLLLSDPVLVLDIFFGTLSSMEPLFQLVSITISILAGALISTIVFKFHSGESISKRGGTGIVLGLFAPACASCGIGLLAILGLGGVIATLPFKGLEISLLAIVLLVAGIISTAKDMNACKQCQIVLKK